jgi:hypothetical protein
MKGEPEFADERFPRRAFWIEPPSEMRNVDIAGLAARSDGELIGIDQHPDCQTIDFGRGSQECLRAQWPDAAQHRHERAQGGAGDDFTPVDLAAEI